jgi:adenosylcobinamide amidohydrolase
LAFRVEAGRPWPVHVWRFAEPLRAISCAPYGGGLGERHWVLNASVHRDYDRLDPDAHIAALAEELGLAGPGAGMLTAVDVHTAVLAADGGVSVVATVGLGHLTRAAAPSDDRDAAAIGTINIVVLLPAPLSDAALVNAVGTATEAKVQALADAGLDATGTATDALVIACPVADAGYRAPYGGPRSTWGSRLARAVHAAVAEGTQRWLEGSRSR